MSDQLQYLRTFRIGVSALSQGEQKQLFNLLPGAFQAALWQDRLNEGIGNVCDKGQAKILENLRDRLSPNSYSDEENNSDMLNYLDESAKYIVEVFPDFSVFQRYTQHLGDDPCKTEIVRQPGGLLPTCTCSSSRSGQLRHNDCGALIGCHAGNCTPTRWGCGILWLQSCDGLCTGKIEPA